MSPMGFKGDGLAQTTSESRANMRRGYGEPQENSRQEAAADRLEHCSRQVELERARQERTGEKSTRLPGLLTQLGHAKGDARRAGVDVEPDAPVEPDDEAA